MGRLTPSFWLGKCSHVMCPFRDIIHLRAVFPNGSDVSSLQVGLIVTYLVEAVVNAGS